MFAAVTVTTPSTIFSLVEVALLSVPRTADEIALVANPVRAATSFATDNPLFKTFATYRLPPVNPAFWNQVPVLALVPANINSWLSVASPSSPTIATVFSFVVAESAIETFSVAPSPRAGSCANSPVAVFRAKIRDSSPPSSPVIKIGLDSP